MSKMFDFENPKIQHFSEMLKMLKVSGERLGYSKGPQNLTSLTFPQFWAHFDETVLKTGYM